MYPGSDISLYPSLSAGLWQESNRRLSGAEGTAEPLSIKELATAPWDSVPHYYPYFHTGPSW